MKSLLLAGLLGIALSSELALAQTFSLFRVEKPSATELRAISKDFEIVGRDGDHYDIYVPLEKTLGFKEISRNAKLIAQDVDADWRKALEQKAFASGYHDWQGVQEFMANAVKSYPQLATIQSYGQSKGAVDLNYLRIGSGQMQNLTKPKLFLDSATHGDELISVEVLIALVDELLKGYGTDERLTAMLDKTDIYISFVVNPDGYLKKQRYENWVDPNRSYPWPGDPSHTPTPSIKALMDLYAKERFAGSISFHAYGKLLMYPWAYTTEELSNDADRIEFASLTESLSATNGYTHGPISEVIYVAKGSSADYYYWKFGTKALAVELSTSKVPSPSRIPAVVDEAREMVWGFIENFYPAAK
jgi:hypothetical protein